MIFSHYLYTIWLAALLSSGETALLKLLVYEAKPNGLLTRGP